MDLFREVMKEYYKEQNDRSSEEVTTVTCKHKFIETVDYQVMCIDCGEMLQEHYLQYEYNKHYNRQSRKCSQHCTKKYFIKFLNKLSSEVTSSLNLKEDYWLLISDFEEQETVLMEVLQDEGKRRNSLGVQYKLYKLLQRREKFYSVPLSEVTSSLKLPKCHKTITEHDRIMKEVWSRLDWDWIETM